MANGPDGMIIVRIPKSNYIYNVSNSTSPITIASTTYSPIGNMGTLQTTKAGNFTLYELPLPFDIKFGNIYYNKIYISKEGHICFSIPNSNSVLYAMSNSGGAAYIAGIGIDPESYFNATSTTSSLYFSGSASSFSIRFNGLNDASIAKTFEISSTSASPNVLKVTCVNIKSGNLFNVYCQQSRTENFSYEQSISLQGTTAINITS